MEQKSSLLKSSLVYGLYLSLISILLSVILWAGSVIESLGLFGGAIIGIVSFVITFVLLLVFSKAYRNKEMGGFITFGQAFQFSILIVIFSTIITTVYNYIFYTIIAPDYMENLMAVMQQKTLDFMTNKGVPDDAIDQAMEKFEETPTIWKTLRQGILSGVIAGAILSLITAAIVKKKDEEAVIEE